MGKRITRILKNGKRKDRGFLFLLNVILTRDRLKYYERYIKFALKKGYIVTSLIDYLENYKGTEKKVLILRHDIDRMVKTAEKMFQVEKDNGVKATYYFRWFTLDREFIDVIREEGFEVGLHYETLAAYCLENGISKICPQVLESIRKQLKDEIERFKKETGIDIKTVASHGHCVNSQIKVSNNVLLENENYGDYGIVCEAYDRELYEKYVSAHIMDAGILNNFGFAYRTNPVDSIQKGEKLIVFLAHPDNWEYSFKFVVSIFVRLITGRYSFKAEREFKRIDTRGLVQEDRNKRIDAEVSIQKGES